MVHLISQRHRIIPFVSLLEEHFALHIHLDERQHSFCSPFGAPYNLRKDRKIGGEGRKEGRAERCCSLLLLLLLQVGLPAACLGAAPSLPPPKEHLMGTRRIRSVWKIYFASNNIRRNNNTRRGRQSANKSPPSLPSSFLH